MSTRNKKKTSRRLRPWASPLIKNPEGRAYFTSSDCILTTRRCGGPMMTPQKPNTKKVSFQLDEVEKMVPVRRSASSGDYCESTIIQSVDITLQNIRHLRRSMQSKRRSVSSAREEAEVLVQEVRGIRNDVHEMLDAYDPFSKLEEELHDSVSSLSEESSSSILLPSSPFACGDDDHNDDEEVMMIQMLHSFLNNLIEEASPIHCMSL